MFDTLKSQMVVGILSGIILLLLLVLPTIAAGVTGKDTFVVPNWIGRVMWWILTGCAIALLVLGIMNYRNGFTTQGITAIVFSVLWFLGVLLNLVITYNYSSDPVHNFSACLTGDLSSISF